MIGAARAGTEGVTQSKEMDGWAGRLAAGTTLFVPGYESDAALVDGLPLREDRRLGRAVPAGHDGAVTLLSRIDLTTGKAARAAYPLQGHAVVLAPRRNTGVFASIRDRRMLAFDATSLDVIALSRPFAEGYTGGGHARYLPDGSALLVTERAPYRAYAGRPEEHFGRITIRDPETLAVLETASCHGIHPHDLQVIGAGRYVAIANYGSTQNRNPAAVVPELVEPSITVIELASGRLVDKITVPQAHAETRHLTAVDDETYFVVQVTKGTAVDGAWATPEGERGVVKEADRLAAPGEAYLAAPLLHIIRRVVGSALVVESAPDGDPSLMRQGLSILHDARHAQVIVTFPSTHCVMIADARTGEITRVLRTDAMGLRYPCGLALHPDGRRYVVTGSFENVFLFDRASHALDRTACRYLPLFRHSHVAIAGSSG